MSSLMPTYARTDVTFERGEGVYLTSTDGVRYLDFGAGVAVNALGHAHPALVAALTEQAGKLWHACNLYRIAGQEKVADRLTAATFADMVFFSNSGAEAMECAIKAARRFHDRNGSPERFRIMTFEGAFHGRTLATIAAGGQPKLLDGFGPPVDGFDQLKIGDLAAVEAAIGAETAGILIEPILGEGGIVSVTPEFLQGVRALCDTHGILLILDEIQTGIGRTGKLFAHEWADITPDIMASAKGLGGGFPVGACLVTERVGAAMTAGSHGSTFGGNPLAMAVAGAVLDEVLTPGFIDHVQKVGACLREKLDELAAAHPDVIEEIRGQGLMMGLKTRVPNTEFISALVESRLLTIVAGDNVTRLLPPLIIDEAHVDEAVGIIDAVATKFSQAAKLAS